MARRSAAPEAREGRPLIETLIVGAIIIGVLSAVFGDPRAAPPGPALLVGDSLFYSAGDELQGALSGDGWELRVEAQPGAGIAGGGYSGVVWPNHLGGLTEATDYQVAVVELGTNGCDGCPSIPAAIDQVMTELADVDVVLWLNVRTESPRPGAELAQQINAELDRATERWPNLDVLPFDDWLDGDPAWIAADGVHLTDAGQLVLADRVRSALRDVADLEG
jgi:hypothetical protein